MTRKSDTEKEQSDLKRWLASAFTTLSSASEVETRRELKMQWRRAAGERARLA